MKASSAHRFVLCLAAIATLAGVHRFVVPVNATTAALSLLLVVLGAATRWGIAESIFASVAGVLAFNFFFLPPVGTFTIADPQNWVALSAFLVTAVTVSQLSSRARQRTLDALARRNEIAKLYELSRALLLDENHEGFRTSVIAAEQVLAAGPISFYDVAGGRLLGAAADEALMIRTAQTGENRVVNNLSVIPVRMGTHVIGSLATPADTLSPAVRESVAGLLAINYERASALDRAATAEAARRNEEFKSALLDGLAHDLKTPLTAIRTCVTHMIDSPPRTEETRQELLSIIDQESIRLERSITEAVELARIESQALGLEKSNIAVEELVAETIAAMRDENTDRYRVIAGKGLTIHGDGTLLQRALGQILENACKYSPPGSSIDISAELTPDAVLLRVADRGVGVAADELQLIFDKFYRGRKGRDRVEGTGMGLSIARSIVAAHGGSIQAQNRDGGGTIFVISLPLDE